jgi:Flp pilus assembly protein TadG
MMRGEHGVATLVLPVLVWLATLVAVVAIDMTAYFVAAARAQQLADVAALAAIGADTEGPARGDPGTVAAQLVDAGGGRVEHCACSSGRDLAQVTVSVAVPGLVIPRLGAGRVSADAEAVLAPPEDLAPGPTRERARWGG